MNPVSTADAPSTQLQPNAPAEPAPDDTGMPSSVRGIVGMLMISCIAAFAVAPAQAVIGLGLLIGVFYRSTLARNALILISAVDVLVTLFAAVEPFVWTALGETPQQTLDAGWVVDSLIYLVLLNRKSARQWFDLRCPRCDGFSVRARWFAREGADRTCGACGHTWTGGKPIDAAAFD